MEKEEKQIVGEKKFNTKIDNLSQRLHAFAYNLTKSVDESKDLFQETAFRAITNRDKFRAGTNFKAWMFTIMKNIFINNYRKKMKQNTIIDTTDNLYFINSGDVEISNGAESSIMVQELERMVEELDDNTRVPFVMHYEGFKYQEIADKLELPLGTVKSRIFFARKALKKMIKDRYYNIYLHREKKDKLAS